jgi:hypothetical protein
MFRYGKVFNYSQKTNTIDCWLINTGGAYYNVPIVSTSMGTNTGSFEFPDLKTVNGIEKKAMDFTGGSDGAFVSVPNLYAFENQNLNNQNLDDPTTSYVYAILGIVDGGMGRSQPVCFGFIMPENNQIAFDPTKVPLNLSEATQAAIPRMAGAYLRRYNSDVYECVDANGNMEWAHPNGTFFRIAETPTEAENGTVHVDFTGANAMAQSLNSSGQYTGTVLNTAWNTSTKTGADGAVNSARKVYAHMEVVTEAGTVVLDIDRVSGSITITTPNNNSATNNQITINCGGNATIVSDNGDISVQTNSGDIDVTSSNDVNITANSSVSITATDTVDITSNNDALNITATSAAVTVKAESINLQSSSTLGMSADSITVDSSTGGSADSFPLLS